MKVVELKKILENVAPVSGYCLIRKDKKNERWWMDANTFSGVSPEETKIKAADLDQRTPSSAEFEKLNPAVLVVKVKLVLE